MKQVQRLILITAIFISGVPALQAQHSIQSVSLGNVDEAIEQALMNNPDLAGYRLQQEKAYSEFKTARNHGLPVISGGFTGQKNVSLPVTPIPGEILGQPGTVVEAQFGQKYNFSTGITISKNLLDWQNILTTKIAHAGTKLAAAQTDAYRQNLSEQVALYYYTAILAQEALEINHKDLANGDRILVLTRQKQEQGIADQFAVNRAEMNVNNIRQSTGNSSILLEQCLHQLQVLLGMEPGTAISFTEKADETATGLPENVVLDPNRNLLVLDQQFIQSDLNVKLQGAARLPKLNTYAYWGKQQYRQDFGLSFRDGSWSNQRYVGVSLSIPIFTGFTNKNKLKTAKIDRSITGTRQINDQRKSAINDDLLLHGYQKSLLLVKAAHENYLLADRNTGLSFQKYQEGIISLDDYFRTMDDCFTAENAWLNALSSLFSYYATIISRQ